MAKTAETATGFQGDKLYQERARLALPILIRQAKAGQTVSYEDLAAELGMPNPRNLNYPLGCIGDELNRLSKKWRKEIPHIQALVVSKGTSVPGKGFDPFLKNGVRSGKRRKSAKRSSRPTLLRSPTIPTGTRSLSSLVCSQLRPELTMSSIGQPPLAAGRGQSTRRSRSMSAPILNAWAYPWAALQVR